MLGLALVKTLDMTDPTIIFGVRCTFAIGISLALGLCAVLYLKIRAADDKQILNLTGADLNPPQPLAAMIGAPPAPDANEQMTLTHREYDLYKLRTVLKTAMTAAAVTLALHYWKGFMPPLVLQSMLAPAGVLNSELAQIHLFGKNPAKLKELKRPWKPKSALSGLADLKKEVQATMNAGQEGKQRKNKKNENKMARRKK